MLSLPYKGIKLLAAVLYMRCVHACKLITDISNVGIAERRVAIYTLPVERVERNDKF